jgi:hypothetical protein
VGPLQTQKNCWEFKHCERQPGGLKTGELGNCPAAIEKRTDGLNHGENGGRCCWAVAGTFCGGKVQGQFAAKLANCSVCEFYKMVQQEEGSGIVKAREILSKLN